MKKALFVLLMLPLSAIAEHWLWKEVVPGASNFSEYHGQAKVTKNQITLLYHDDGSERGVISYTIAGEEITGIYETYETEREKMKLVGVCKPAPNCSYITLTNARLTIMLFRPNDHS